MAPKNKDKKIGKRQSGTPRTPSSMSSPQESSASLRIKSSAKAEDGHGTATAIPVEIRQEILDIFPKAFPHLTSTRGTNELKEQIQAVKNALYNRDFETAFASAPNQEAYCLRWSPTRALAYTDLFSSIPQLLSTFIATTRILQSHLAESKTPEGLNGSTPSWNETVVLSIGGGAGAELVALDAILKQYSYLQMIPAGGKNCTPVTERDVSISGSGDESRDSAVERSGCGSPSVRLNAVDIADWSHVLNLLSNSLTSQKVKTEEQKTSLWASATAEASDVGNALNEQGQSPISLNFLNQDILSMTTEELQALLVASDAQNPPLITIFFTLNELYSISMPKTTALLLKLTDLAPKGTQLLVVDSPGSYSTVGLNGSAEKKYPMQWLLDHTLLEATREERKNNQTTEGKQKRMPAKWEKIDSEESRWWRMDRTKLKYRVPGIELENMRMQWHFYRRV